MKKIKFGLMALTLALFSCQDAIDIVQPGELYPENAFQTVEDLQQGLVGVYGVVPGETEIAFSSVWTDEVRIGVGNGGQGLISGEYAFVMNPTTDEADVIWRSYYFLINFANRIISAAENVTPATEAEQMQYDNIIAQAHILRAWGHFKLEQYYTTNMADDSALGVLLVDFVPSTTTLLPRSTNGEVFALIESDLAYVDDLIASDAVDSNGDDVDGGNADNADRKFISADFVKAFRARMALYRGDFATAETLADELIATYPLTPGSQYANFWKDNATTVNTANDECIFRLDRVPGDATVGSIWASVDTTISGSPFYEMSTDLYALLSGIGDRRMNAFVSTTQNETIHPIAKYPGSAGATFLNDLKIFRASEMYFIKAEARANASDLAGVAAALQPINNVRFTPGNVPVIATPESVTDAWGQILVERRKELCYEGHRYTDLKRLGTKANMQINRDPADCAINGACTLSTTDYRFTLPIPFTEIRVNPQVRAQQNPGYESN